MGTTQAGTGSAGVLQLTVNEVGYNAAGNYSTVQVVASIYTPAGTYDYDNLSVSLSGGINWSTGTWSFDSSGGWHTLYNGTVNVGHNPDGTGSFGVTFSLNSNTGTSGVGGPASVYNAIGLTTLTVPPGQPYGLTATRASDSTINLAWSRSYASNGVPTGTTIQQSVNGGAFGTVATSGNIASASVSAAANQKLVYQVAQSNSAGSSAWSSASAAIWTTPAAPTACTATKQGTGSIIVSWANNVAYAEYGTEVWHGTVANGTTTWDASPLTTAASGATSYTHTGPDPSVVHVYQVRAVTTSGTVLQSSYATSNSVQLLTAPNAPTLATLPQFANKAAALAINWTHNAVDSTAQTAFEVQRSTDGGTTWTTTGKTTSTVSSFTIAASMYAANTAVQVQVRTWGQATTGGSDGTGASPWSTAQTVTFKTAPTLAITQPTSGTGLAQAHASVNLSFAQAEGATAVAITVTLLQGATVLETVNTTSLTGIPLATRLADGSTYTIGASVTDSNGLTGTAPSQTFLVTYTEPVQATVGATYDDLSGMAQVNVGIPTPASNIFTNGDMETPGAPVTVYTNLLTNPGFEAASGTVVVRTNLCTNPRMLTLTGWANGSAGAVTQTATASGQQYDVTGTIVNTNIVTYQSNAITVSPGDVVVTSMQVSVPAGFPAVSLYLDAQEYNPSTGIYARGATVTVQPGQTATIPSGVLTADSTATAFRSVLRFAASTPVGARLIVSNCLVEKASAAAPYFDGTSSPDPDLTPAWTGAVDASTSTLSGPKLTNWTQQNAVAYQSASHHRSRANSGAALLNPAVSAGLFSSFTQVVGSVYTLSAWVYSPAALTVRAAYTNGTVTAGGTATAVPANTWTQVWVTGTATTTGGFLSVLTTVAPPAGALLYADDAVAILGGVALDHMDGTSSPDPDLTPAWTGTADASTSTLSAPTVAATSYSAAYVFQSSQWAKSGSKSLRIVPDLNNTSSAAAIAATNYTGLAPLVEGNTYTVLATRHLPAPLTGTLDPNYSSALLFTANAGYLYASALPNVAGDTDIRWTFTVPVGSGGAYLFLGHGGAWGSGDVYWDDAALVQVPDIDHPYTGTYENVGRVEAAEMTVTRTILGTTETIVDHMQVTGDITLVDTTPTINGTNTYAVTTYSADGAASAPATSDMVTTESKWAFLSSGDGYASAVKFYGDLTLGSSPARDAALVVAAGRSKPISLFGQATGLDVSATATIVIGDGSTPEEIESFLLTAGLACLRDPSGRRVFGIASGSLANRTPYTADLSLKVSEAQ